MTLKRRVEAFWDWFEEVGPRFTAVINNKKAGDLSDEISENLDRLLPGLSWALGPGDDEEDHSFTLSGEGNLNLQLVTGYWLKRSRPIPAWTFYSSRQPGKLGGSLITFENLALQATEIWLTPTIDVEHERIDLQAWHPQLEEVSHREAELGLYLFLTEVLGEFGTGRYIGRLRVSAEGLGDSFPLSELKEYVEGTANRLGWKNTVPGTTSSVYRPNEYKPGFHRDDVIVGSTVNLRLISEYMSTAGRLRDPLAGLGADFVYLSFASSSLPKGDESNARGEYEDALYEALTREGAGIVLGGALGRTNAYIDMMLFDGETSIQIIKEVLLTKPLPAPGELHYFAMEKKGYRQVLE